MPSTQLSTLLAGTVNGPARFVFKIAVSVGNGTWFGFQFAALDQSPPLVLVQVMTAPMLEKEPRIKDATASTRPGGKNLWFRKTMVTLSLPTQAFVNENS